MKTSRKRLGDLGEDLACRHLEQLGHTVLERNWRSSHLEIDLITLDDEGLHFVEVKSRTAPVSASPEDNVGYRKRRNLTTAALGYLNAGHFGDRDVFFDIVTVIFDGERTEIRYYKQAFIPIYT
ncbi:MAG: YraN family protein [Bacteroidales bacterium]|nr:YraN family protein [Bacteroidales bacterium]